MNQKHDLRDSTPKPGLTPTDLNVDVAGERDPKVAPSTGRMVTPDPGNVVDGQGSKSN